MGRSDSSPGHHRRLLSLSLRLPNRHIHGRGPTRPPSVTYRSIPVMPAATTCAGPRVGLPDQAAPSPSCTAVSRSLALQPNLCLGPFTLGLAACGCPQLSGDKPLHTSTPEKDFNLLDRNAARRTACGSGDPQARMATADITADKALAWGLARSLPLSVPPRRWWQVRGAPWANSPR